LFAETLPDAASKLRLLQQGGEEAPGASLRNGAGIRRRARRRRRLEVDEIRNQAKRQRKH